MKRRLKSRYKHLKKQVRKRPFLYSRLAGVELELGKPKPARARLFEGLETDPDNPTAHFLLARACRMLKDYETALREYERAFELDRLNRRARKEYADLLRELGRRDRERTAVRELYLLSPFDEEVEDHERQLIEEELHERYRDDVQWDEQWHPADFSELGALARAVAGELSMTEPRPDIPDGFLPDIDESELTQMLARLPGRAEDEPALKPVDSAEEEEEAELKEASVEIVDLPGIKKAEPTGEEEEPALRQAEAVDEEDEQSMRKGGPSEEIDEPAMKKADEQEEPDEPASREAAAAEAEEEAMMKQAAAGADVDEPGLKEAAGAEREDEPGMKQAATAGEVDDPEMKRAEPAEGEEEPALKQAGASEENEDAALKRATPAEEGEEEPGMKRAAADGDEESEFRRRATDASDAEEEPALRRAPAAEAEQEAKTKAAETRSLTPLEKALKRGGQPARDVIDFEAPLQELKADPPKLVDTPEIDTHSPAEDTGGAPVEIERPEAEDAAASHPEGDEPERAEAQTTSGRGPEQAEPEQSPAQPAPQPTAAGSDLDHLIRQFAGRSKHEESESAEAERGAGPEYEPPEQPAPQVPDHHSLRELEKKLGELEGERTPEPSPGEPAATPEEPAVEEEADQHDAEPPAEPRETPRDTEPSPPASTREQGRAVARGGPEDETRPEEYRGPVSKTLVKLQIGQGKWKHAEAMLARLREQSPDDPELTALAERIKSASR